MSNHAKDLRKQQRNIIQQTLPELLASEAGQSILKQVTDEMGKRIEVINQYCTDQLVKMDKRARDVQGFLMREVKGNIHHSMSDMDVTIDAITRVLAESGVVVEDFYEKVQAKKPIIITERREAAEAKMKEDLEAQQNSVPSEPVIPAPVATEQQT